jgi:hypothetical protein
MGLKAAVLIFPDIAAQDAHEVDFLVKYIEEKIEILKPKKL